jgi:phosphate transport system permease protein
MKKVSEHRKFWRMGEPYVWVSGATLATILGITVILLLVIMKNGLGVFWPKEQALIVMKDGPAIQGGIMQREVTPKNKSLHRIQLKTGNRDIYGIDFKWINEEDIQEVSYPADLTIFEREEWGNFVGYVDKLILKDEDPIDGGEAYDALPRALAALEPHLEAEEKLDEKISKVNKEMTKLRHKRLKLEYHNPDGGAQDRVDQINLKYDKLTAEMQLLLDKQISIRKDVSAFTITYREAGGQIKTRPLSELVRYYRPNEMSTAQKVWFYITKIGELLTDEPRESNTEGGLFPAIFGTVMLVFVMSILSFPLGLMAGIYLREYAKENFVVRLVRIAVNNLAGVPSIVYGIFGLGFFIYGIGGSIDALFYPERLPEPTFGTGGILWASMTLGLLTIPVVIVSTEEAFGSIPQGVRQASLALGATRFQTLVRVLFPMASPGVMTGFILAMARAAGEVAPLMITGVVKLAPSLPLDGDAPFLHLERKFMHLGFHIYDIGFQSPNAEAAKPMVFVTTLLLVLIVLMMSSVAIWFRERMKRKHSMRSL